MGAAKHDGLAVPGRVVLAHEPPFQIGDLAVNPPTRQVECGALGETLEPRVMQVLVALYQGGGIVTRDELVERCWDGRVVGDDSINRVVSRLRHIAADIGGGSFAIETITKVGYRLTLAGLGSTRSSAKDEPASSIQSDRRKMVGAIVAAGAAATVGGSVLWQYLGKGDKPPEAKLLYDRALALRDGSTQGDNRQRIAYLREAVRIAPEYGEAWGALALAYRGALLSDPPEEVAGFRERLEEALRQADRYDPGNADAAFARRLQGLFFGRWARMEPVYRDLVRRFPKHPAGHALLGSLLMDVGRWNEAVEALLRSKSHNALAPLLRYKLTVSLWSAGRISEAEHEIDEALRWSTHGAIWQTKIKLLAMTGRPQAALAIVNDPVARPDEATEAHLRRWRLFLDAMISRAPADIDSAVKDLADFARLDTGPPVPQAFQCVMLGRPEVALEMLEGCYLGIGEWSSKRPAEPSSSAAHPLFQPQARALWREPRFEAILSGIGLEQYWRETGTMPDYRRG